MKGKRYTTEQKIRILREAEKSDKTILDVCREQQISEQTFHRWKKEFGMMEVDQAKQLKELQKENARLKRMLADEMLGKELLKEALEKSCEPRAQAADSRKACIRGCRHARAACRHFGLHRATFAYRAKQPNAWLSKLKSAVRRVSNQYPGMGYPKIARLLEREGWSAGARIVRRLRRELGLAVPAKKPKRRRRGPSTGIPTKATHRNHVWTWDFVHDTTMRGGTLRMLNVLDEYTRECLCIHVDRRINARKVRRIMSALIERHGAPRTYPQRQRFGVHRERAAQLACRESDQDALHRAWKPLAERIRGELQRAFPRGVPQPRAALDSDRGSSGNRRLAMEVQQHTPPSLAGLYYCSGVRSGTAGGNRTEPMLGLQSAYGLLATQH